MSDSEETKYLEDIPQEIQDLILNGEKIEAIKATRNWKRLGLKDSKDWVEKMTHDLYQLNSHIPIPEAKGCMSLITIVFTLSSVAYFLSSGI